MVNNFLCDILQLALILHFFQAGSTESLSLANSDSSKEKSLRIEEPIVPRIVSECVSYLESNIRTLGLFRVSAAKARVSKLKQKLDRGIIKSLYEVDEDIGPHDICAVLKDFLRELVDPVISAQLYTTIIRIMTGNIFVALRENNGFQIFFFLNSRDQKSPVTH